METLEMKIDPETGLPVVPEGYWWRVEEGFKWEDGELFRPYWSSSERKKISTGPEVQLMKAYTEHRTLEVPVYKQTWYGGTRQIGTQTEDQEVSRVAVDRSAKFFGNSVWNREAPALAVNKEKGEYNGRDYIKYDIPLTKEGTAYLATLVYKEWAHYEEQRRAREAEIQRKKDDEEQRQRDLVAFKENFFGDYPPKTLVKA